MKKAILTVFALFAVIALTAQVGFTSTVLVNVTPNPNGTITLTWPKATFSGKYNIYKNTSSTPLNFTTPVASPVSSDSTWTDNSFVSGMRAEYAVVKVDGANKTLALGYVEAGNKAVEIPTFGSLILVIDSNYILPLAQEIGTLVKDLEANGFPVSIVYAGRKETPAAVKARIKSVWESAKPTPQFAYLLGRIPVPYSGYYSGLNDGVNYYGCAVPPDGHVEGSGNHTGAWPSDVYYGDFEGLWTDNSVTITTGSLTRHHNIPGDGKFDQCSPPSPVTLQIGRVDLTSMSSFTKSDTALTKAYLDRVHDWRVNNIPFVKRGLVDDNFTSLNLSATGYNTMTNCINRDSIYKRDYFTYQGIENYLLSYGCGAGSYTSCSGVGNTTNFAQTSNFNNIFTMLAGSYFGDWDAPNNFLRAPLCRGSLFSFWGGIPRWYTHSFGIGKPIGFSTMLTQNNKTVSFNSSQNKTHIALMGDPTLTLATAPPCNSLSASSVSGKVNLSWSSATGSFDGYVIFRIDTVTNTWTRLNSNIITGTSFADDKNWSTGKYKYAVRTIRLENSGSGSYYVLGSASFAWVNHTNSTWKAEPLKISIFPNPANESFTINLGAQSLRQANIKMFDAMGKEVEVAVADQNEHTVTLLSGNHSAGLYLIQVQTLQGVGSAKVQISR